MADVATSVLHNVGNVLNSVNVSAGLVANLARGSQGAGLQKAMGLLRAQPDARRFLAEDPRGQKLIDYLGAIAEAVGGEREKMLAELEVLAKNMEHIKVIVSRQQSHAKAGGVIERLSLPALLDDAIKLNWASLEKDDTQVVCDCGEVQDVEVDRHRLFQILTNLLSNARHAVKDRDGERRVIIRARRVDEERVDLEVEDNGIGISAENLTKIFSHGFTTKPDGHGFGLHSSACTAIEIGGSLSAHSEGVGHGARFTITFPRIAAAGMVVA